MNYSVGTVQFKLLLLDYLERQYFAKNLVSFALDKIVDIVSVGLVDVVEQASRQSYVNANQDIKKGLLRYLDPFWKENEEHEQRQTASKVDSGAQIIKALSMAEPKGFKTLGQLASAMRGLQSATQELKKKL